VEIPPTTGDRIWRYTAGAAALAFTVVPAVRASGLLAFLCLAAAILLGSYALVGGRTWLELVTAALVLIPGVAQGLHWLSTHRPRRGNTATSSGGMATVARVTFTVVLTLFLVAILLPLLRSADPIFADLIDSWVEHLPRLEGRTIAGALALAAIAIGAAFFAHRGPFAVSSTVERNRPLGGLDWMIPLVVVNLIFAVFVAVQIQVLFGGHDYVLGIGGPDYADYARRGFGELCAVTVIALGLVATVGAFATQETARQRVMVRTAGGLLCALTLVIVASALQRMLLYVDAYGFTWRRLLPFTVEVWLGLVFVLLLVAGIRLRGSWLPRAIVASGAAVLFALVAVDPEALIARTTLARLETSYPVDYAYLDTLSADAVDEILRLPRAERNCALNELSRELQQPDPWYAYNLAREHARAALADVEIGRCDYSEIRRSQR
jgi:hypothetical protein